MEKPFREDEIALLKEIARLFRENKERILENWVAQQDAGFAWFDFLKEGIKMLIEDFVKYISRGDIERYLEGNSLIGKKIATRDVPYKAFIDAFHEFEDAYVDILKENYKENILNSLTILDRLHHSTISILAREYFTIKDATISAMAKLTESKDPETGAHIERTKEYVRVIAEALGCDKDFVQKIHTASPLHDIGKVAIPDGILLKPGPLTKEEFEVIKTHTRVGGNTIDRIIENLKIVRGELLVARDIAWYHHENYDGSGYFGLAGENIPLAARIFKIADVYDALTTKRPYKEAFSQRRAFEIITEGDGRVMPSHFDPRVLSAF
ncbi:HD domain-containing protein, partial [Candidatus Aerophobetes bacterium]|nr:HD domain-containing protein [Candidatus Aerophobetes bacterium]